MSQKTQHTSEYNKREADLHRQRYREQAVGYQWEREGGYYYMGERKRDVMGLYEIMHT